jgi:hypothetical protein
MPKSPPATATPTEWLLARIAGPTRAAAILGDLLELSATRGRLWFWIAYVHTLVSLGWRAPVAFLCAYFFSSWVATAGFSTLRHLFGFRFRSSPGHVFHPALHAIWHVPMGDSLIALWFILPFVLVRFGVRDRLTWLTCALFLLTIPFFSLSAAGVNFAGVVTAATVLAALCLRGWRRPMIVLVATVGPIAVAIFFSAKVWYLFLSRGYGYASPQLQRAMTLYRALELSIAAIVCSSLYRRLLQMKPTDRSTIA